MQHKPLLYNPAQKSKQQTIDEFVIRIKHFETLFNEIKAHNKTTPPQHYLIAGQRGMGKTTLLLRLKYAIDDQNQ